MRIAILLLGLSQLLITYCAADETPPPADRGLYAIWYGKNQELLDVPYIVGGQVVAQWNDVDKGNGRYDFSPIARELKELQRLGETTTIQINGNRKPDWLFAQVPCYPEKLSTQVSDPRGTLMYWHPVHLRAYTDLLRAFADFLSRSDVGEVVIGIRLNFNAVGTEHFTIPPAARNLAKWVVPKNGTQGPAWSAKVVQEYQATVVETFVKELSPHAKIFVRNTIKPEIEQQYRSLFESGKLAWFHTSSEAEPRATFAELKYRRFYDDCRSGKTVAYAEPWASAWGDHGVKTDDRWCSPPQWNYWRLLIDLHCGVSHIALYASDMNVAVKGTYRYRTHSYNESQQQLGYQREFDRAFRFAAKYAGYHASPTQSPGAWVAFRENSTVLAENGMPAQARKLSFFTGDYNFLMERLPDQTRGEHNVGPDNQRQGAWARVLPAGKAMRLRLDEQFADSLDGGTLRVTYLDRAADTGSEFTVVAGATQQQVVLKGTDRWQEAIVSLSAGPLRPTGQPAHVVVTAGSQPLRLHMVEVERAR